MPDMNNLEARLRRVEDTLAIKELTSRYAYAIDDRDREALAECFTKDAVLGAPMDRAKGRENVVNHLFNAMVNNGPTMHVMHVHKLDWHEDGRASGVLSAHAENSMKDGTLLKLGFRYYDKYAFEDGKWRISERRLKTLYMCAAEEYPDVFRHGELRKRFPGGTPAPSDNFLE